MKYIKFVKHLRSLTAAAAPLSDVAINMFLVTEQRLNHSSMTVTEMQLTHNSHEHCQTHTGR